MQINGILEYDEHMISLLINIFITSFHFCLSTSSSVGCVRCALTTASDMSIDDGGGGGRQQQQAVTLTRFNDKILQSESVPQK